jgi:prepilin-type N-terminal cleavage/methylation domain-containing protein
MDRDGVIDGGFSLLELVLVTAILAVVSAIAIPRYGCAATRYQADLAARRVAADLRQAQAHAKTTGASCTVVFSVATGTYHLVNVPSLDRSPGDYTVDLTAEPYRAALLSASFNGASQVIFNGWGLPDNGGSVVVAVGAQQKTILVDRQTGQVGIQGGP